MLLLAFGASSAMAAGEVCQEFGIAPQNAREGDQVGYSLKGCTVGASWDIRVLYYEGTDDQGNPIEHAFSTRNDGVISSTDPVTGTFVVPDLGDGSRDVTVRLRGSHSQEEGGGSFEPFNLSGSLGLTYLGLALPTGPTGPTTPTGTTGPMTVPPVPVKTVTPAQAETKAKKETTSKKKKSSSGKSKSKSKSNSDNGSSNPSTPSTPTYTPPATSTPAPSTVTPATTPDDLSTTPNTTADPPAAAPPGALGPGGGEPVVPPAPTPTAPGAAALAPVAASGDDDMAVPIWLVILLGLVALAGLGGAQARLLGLWGPPLPIGPDTSDARLLALQRVSQSGASFQKRIAELKQAAREREPVG